MSTRSGKNSEQDRETAIDEEQRSRRLKRDYARWKRLADEAAAAAEREAELEQGGQQPEERPVPEQVEPQPGHSRHIADDVLTPPNSVTHATPPVNPFGRRIVRMLFDTENDSDPADIATKANNAKLEWKKDIQFWLQQLEVQMRFIGIKSQWTKMQVVERLLPEKAAEDVKHLLRIREEDAGETCYKTLKDYIIDLYGTKDEDVYDRAAGLMITSTPSHLARQLIDIVCHIKVEYNLADLIFWFSEI